MNTHPLTETAAAKIWDSATAPSTGLLEWATDDRTPVVAALRAAFDAGREHEREHADAGWEPLDREDELRVGDEVRYMYGGLTRSGIVASFDGDDDPRTGGDRIIGFRNDGTWSVRRAPVTWHRLPTEHPAHLTDVTGVDGDTCAYMALSRGGLWVGVDQDSDSRSWVPEAIHACTLDGTRLVCDGDFEDGEPRFREEADQ